MFSLILIIKYFNCNRTSIIYTVSAFKALSLLNPFFFSIYRLMRLNNGALAQNTIYIIIPMEEKIVHI